MIPPSPIIEVELGKIELYGGKELVVSSVEQPDRKPSLRISTCRDGRELHSQQIPSDRILAFSQLFTRFAKRYQAASHGPHRVAPAPPGGIRVQ